MSQRKSFEPKSDLDEQRKSVSAWGEVAAAVTHPLRQRYSAQVLRLRWRKCFKVAAQIVTEILIADETLEMGLSGLEAGFCSDGANAPFCPAVTGNAGL
jgi:ABC-type polysaccharide/polyol phosphate transport system ATPase subunit